MLKHVNPTKTDARKKTAGILQDHEKQAHEKPVPGGRVAICQVYAALGGYPH